MINQNKNQTNGNGLGENKNERGKMTSWLERWWDEEKDGEEGNDSEATFSVVNATQIMSLRPMFFSLIPFFFSCFQIRIFSLFLSLCSIFSLFLSLYSILKPLGYEDVFNRNILHQSIPTKGQNIKFQQMQKRCWNGRGERAKLSLPLLCTFVHNLNGEKFTRALVHARQMQQGGTFSVS